MTLNKVQDERIAQLQTQVAMLTQATTAFLGGVLDGPGSAKAFLLALDPTLEVTPAPFDFGTQEPDLPGAPTLWVDISNYTGPLTDEGCRDLLKAGYVGCIIQAITGLNGMSYTRQQLAACLRNGLRIKGYIWCFNGSSVESRLHMFDDFPIEDLWLDVEETVSVFAVNRDLTLCDLYTGQLTGIYSGKWFFDKMGWSASRLWANRPLWDSNYDHNPALVNFRPYGGWTRCAIKQFKGTSSVGRVNQVDLNIAA